MATPYRMKELEQTHGDLRKVIPDVVNRTGSQAEAARELGISTASVSRWLKDNGFRPVVKWEREKTGLLDLEEMP